MSTALVLAGGGVTGIAWETGVLLGLREQGHDLTTPDLVLGTSAGSTVGAQLLSGVDLADLYARQLSDDHEELTPELDIERLMTFFVEYGAPSSDRQTLAKMGAFAKETATVPVATRRAVIEWRLPSHEWPQVLLRVTAVDADTGELVVLDRTSGASLVDAVAASCAVPGVWPPVPVLGRTLIDGGMRSVTNLDLAEGYDDVIVLGPMGGPVLDGLQREAEALRSKGSHVQLVTADEEATQAMGLNALDPTMRRAAAETGLRQGRTARLS